MSVTASEPTSLALYVLLSSNTPKYHQHLLQRGYLVTMYPSDVIITPEPELI